MSQTALEQLLACLEDEATFWLEVHEMSVVAAYESARRMSLSEWTAMDGVWQSRSSAWQRRFADVLAEAGPPQAEAWLLAMIERGDEALALRATEDFRELQKRRPIPTPVPEAVIDRIRTLWRKHHGFTAEQLRSLLEDLAHPKTR